MDAAIAKFVFDGAIITVNINEEHAREVEKIFEKDDKNKDGFISYDEYPKKTKKAIKNAKNYVEVASANARDTMKVDL